MPDFRVQPLDYKDISFKPLAQDVHLKDITITSTDDSTEVNIEKIIIREIDEKADVPTVLDMSMQGLLVDVKQPLAQTSFLQEAGYPKDLKFDIDTKYQYDPTNREISLETLNVSADQVGDLNVTMKLGNIDLKDLESHKANPSNKEPIFHTFEMTYRDHSFAEKFLAYMADEQGISVDQLKTQMTTQLTQASQFFLSADNELATKAVGEVVTFIEDPKGFSISVNPEDPLQLDRLIAENPDNWADVLNIEIKAF